MTRAIATNNKEERENQTLHAYCKAQYDDKRPKIYTARNLKKRVNPCMCLIYIRYLTYTFY